MSGVPSLQSISTDVIATVLKAQLHAAQGAPSDHTDSPLLHNPAEDQVTSMDEEEIEEYGENTASSLENSEGSSRRLTPDNSNVLLAARFRQDRSRPSHTDRVPTSQFSTFTDRTPTTSFTETPASPFSRKTLPMMSPDTPHSPAAAPDDFGVAELFEEIWGTPPSGISRRPGETPAVNVATTPDTGGLPHTPYLQAESPITATVINTPERTDVVNPIFGNQERVAVDDPTDAIVNEAIPAAFQPMTIKLRLRARLPVISPGSAPPVASTSQASNAVEGPSRPYSLRPKTGRQADGGPGASNSRTLNYQPIPGESSRTTSPSEDLLSEVLDPESSTSRTGIVRRIVSHTMRVSRDKLATQDMRYIGHTAVAAHRSRLHPDGDQGIEQNHWLSRIFHKLWARIPPSIKDLFLLMWSTCHFVTLPFGTLEPEPTVLYSVRRCVVALRDNDADFGRASAWDAFLEAVRAMRFILKVRPSLLQHEIISPTLTSSVDGYYLELWRRPADEVPPPPAPRQPGFNVPDTIFESPMESPSPTPGQRRVHFDRLQVQELKGNDPHLAESFNRAGASCMPGAWPEGGAILPMSSSHIGLEGALRRDILTRPHPGQAVDLANALWSLDTGADDSASLFRQAPAKSDKSQTPRWQKKKQESKSSADKRRKRGLSEPPERIIPDDDKRTTTGSSGDMIGRTIAFSIMTTRTSSVPGPPLFGQPAVLNFNDQGVHDSFVVAFRDFRVYLARNRLIQTSIGVQFWFGSRAISDYDTPTTVGLRDCGIINAESPDLGRLTPETPITPGFVFSPSDFASGSDDESEVETIPESASSSSWDEGRPSPSSKQPSDRERQMDAMPPAPPEAPPFYGPIPMDSAQLILTSQAAIIDSAAKRLGLAMLALQEGVNFDSTAARQFMMDVNEHFVTFSEVVERLKADAEVHGFNRRHYEIGEDVDWTVSLHPTPALLQRTEQPKNEVPDGLEASIYLMLLHQEAKTNLQQIRARVNHVRDLNMPINAEAQGSRYNPGLQFAVDLLEQVLAEAEKGIHSQNKAVQQWGCLPFTPQLGAEEVRRRLARDEKNKADVKGKRKAESSGTDKGKGRAEPIGDREKEEVKSGFGRVPGLSEVELSSGSSAPVAEAETEQVEEKAKVELVGTGKRKGGAGAISADKTAEVEGHSLGGTNLDEVQTLSGSSVPFDDAEREDVKGMGKAELSRADKGKGRAIPTDDDEEQAKTSGGETGHEAATLNGVATTADEMKTDSMDEKSQVQPTRADKGKGKAESIDQEEAQAETSGSQPGLGEPVETSGPLTFAAELKTASVDDKTNVEPTQANKGRSRAIFTKYGTEATKTKAGTFKRLRPSATSGWNAADGFYLITTLDPITEESKQDVSGAATPEASGSGTVDTPALIRQLARESDPEGWDSEDRQEDYKEIEEILDVAFRARLEDL